MPNPLQDHLAKRKHGIPSGIYSVCSAHPWVIQAAADQAAEDGSLLLIEATSNQVNQLGGYTGMRPQAFRDFVLRHVREARLPESSLILGGDHLGPNPWRTLPASAAMKEAEVMVAEYVQAGFAKIHLDTSMPCADDPLTLTDEIVAERAVQLCKAAEEIHTAYPAPLYVIGTEVPTPGGATHSLQGVEVTSSGGVLRTLEVHQRAFESAGLKDAWSRVIALVVQPGVEFDHDSVVNYDHEKAKPLREWLARWPAEIVFEAHSTDYQLPEAYRRLVEDGFAILKVGPALTFAMREALYALEDIEAQLIPRKQSSELSRVVEETMLQEPADWMAYYSGSAEQKKLLRLYSYSDRMRYYWHRPSIAAAVHKLITNLENITVPTSMYSRYLPAQYARLREGKIVDQPAAMIVDRIRDVLRVYAAACK